MNRTAVVLFAGDARCEEAQKGLPARFLATLHDRLTRAIRAFDVDLLIADDLVDDCALGEKIERTFATTFARGYERVIVLGVGKQIADRIDLRARQKRIAVGG